MNKNITKKAGMKLVLPLLFSFDNRKDNMGMILKIVIITTPQEITGFTDVLFQVNRHEKDTSLQSKYTNIIKSLLNRILRLKGSTQNTCFTQRDNPSNYKISNSH